MGMCKECNEVYSAIEMQDGYCNNCFVPVINKEPLNNQPKIYGDEILTLEPIITKSKQNSLGTLLLFSIFGFIIGLFMGSWTICISTVVIMIIIGILIKPNEDETEEHQRILSINTWFKKQYPLLNEFKTQEHILLDTIDVEDEDKSIAMFEIYMNAYKLNADAIVLNSSNISTEVYGKVSTTSRGHSSGTTSSSNTFHITATIIQFKNKELTNENITPLVKSEDCEKENSNEIQSSQSCTSSIQSFQTSKKTEVKRSNVEQNRMKKPKKRTSIPVPDAKALLIFGVLFIALLLEVVSWLSKVPSIFSELGDWISYNRNSISFFMFVGFIIFFFVYFSNKVKDKK